ncbi:MAG: anti-sigma factor, partial [Burkholderiales bacterium]|nr:anti-sigma factor [Burkholderiales bacterium]
PWQRWWQGLAARADVWRNWSFASTAFAAALLVVMLLQPGAPSLPASTYVAALENDQAKTVALVTGDSARHELVVKMLQPPSVSAQQTLQLWAVPKQGNPRSLGLVAVNANGSLTLPLPANVTPNNIPLLAISLEPKGGSPNPNGPSGPIVLKGAWVQI